MSFSIKAYGAHRDLHSFPTRRSSDLSAAGAASRTVARILRRIGRAAGGCAAMYAATVFGFVRWAAGMRGLYRNAAAPQDRKSTRLNSSHMSISYAVFCLKKKNNNTHN